MRSPKNPRPDVRTCRSEDAPLLSGLHRRCFDSQSAMGVAWDISSMNDVLRIPGTFALLINEGAQPAGLAIARVVAEAAELLTIGVIPEKRGGGMGSMLLAAAIQNAAAHGAKKMTLEVAETNRDARALYHRFGFAELGYRRGYYKVRVPGVAAVSALVMGRDLVPED